MLTHVVYQSQTHTPWQQRWSFPADYPSIGVATSCWSERGTANLLTCQSGRPAILRESEQYPMSWSVERKVTVLEQQLVQ